MIEVSWKGLIDLFLVVVYSQLALTQTPTPYCSYSKVRNILIHDEASINNTELETNNNCKIIKEADNCLSSTHFMSLDMIVSDLYSTTNGQNTSVNYSYVNVTVDFDWGIETNRILLLEKPVGTCWSVQVTGAEYRSHVLISMLPVSPAFTGLIAATDFNKVNEHHISRSSKKSCEQLESSVLVFFPVANSQAVKLKINTTDEDGEFKVELMWGDCNITCNGYTNACNVNIESRNLLMTPMTKFQKQDFKNLTPAFYCARIGLMDNSCVIYTETVRLYAPVKADVKIDGDSMAFYAFLTIVIVIVVILLILFIFTKHTFVRIMIKLKPPLKHPHGECTVSLVHEYDMSLLIDEMGKTVEVFLIYSFTDFQHFRELTASFRKLLSCYVNKVWDPYSDEDMESVEENHSRWLTNIVLKPNIKVILFETEKAVQREQMWIEGKEEPFSESQHCLHNFFILSLSYLNNNIHHLPDVDTRMFIVRVNPSVNTTFKILPPKRYQLPDDFETLLFYMSRNLSRSKNIKLQDFTRYRHRSQMDDFISKQDTLNKTAVDY